MICLAPTLRAKCRDTLEYLRQRLSLPEVANIDLAVNQIPTVGVAKAKYMRNFLGELSRAWLFTDSSKFELNAENTLALFVGLMDDKNAWLTTGFIDTAIINILDLASRREGNYKDY